MVLVVNRKQLVIARETLANTLASGIGSAANAKLLVEEPTFEESVEFYERNFAYDSQTDSADVPTVKTIRVSFKCEMRGTLTVDSLTLPAWAEILEACGMRAGFCDTYTIGAITGGPLRHGEIITQTGTSATAMVMHDTFTGAATLVAMPEIGSATSNGTGVWTGGSTGATVTPSAKAVSQAYTWFPWKEVVKQITIASATGGWAVGAVFKGNTSNARGVVWRAVAATNTTLYYRPIRGTFTAGETLSRLDGGAGTEVVGGSTGEAYFISPPVSLRLYEDGNASTVRSFRGNWEFSATANRPVIMTFTGFGILDSVADITPLTGIAYQFGNPPLFENSAIGFADETLTTKGGEAEPELNEIVFNLGQNPQLRIAAGQAGGAIETFHGERRSATGSIDPEATLESDTPLNFRTKFTNGTVCRLNFTVGSTDANRFYCSMPGVQFSGSTRGNRNGILTRALPFKATGGSIGNLAGGAPTITSIGGENEVVLTYFLDIP